MKVYLFNPGHDEALAAGTPYYTPTRIARKMSEDLWQLPQLLADTDGKAFPLNELKHFDKWDEVTEIVPWGWDAALVHSLSRLGVPNRLLSTPQYLQCMRQLSSRHTAVQLLERLTKPTPVTSRFFDNEDDVYRFVEEHNGAVAKAPWSCSGRGVIRLSPTPTTAQRGRIARILQQQRGIAVEPIYPRTADFAMEYIAHADGTITYEGLSLFHTTSTGQYLGNVVASQEYLLAQLAPFDFQRVREEVRTGLETLLAGDYVGPIGVDMLQFSTPDGFATCPCVEINMRYTMGHVALRLYQTQLTPEQVAHFRIGKGNGKGKLLCGNPDGIAAWLESE